MVGWWSFDRGRYQIVDDHRQVRKKKDPKLSKIYGLFTYVLSFRFDPVYVGHFKCNLKTIEKDYPNTLRWARQLYQIPGGT